MRLICSIILCCLLASCAPTTTPTAIPPSFTPSPPTATFLPSATSTSTPEPTATLWLPAVHAGTCTPNANRLCKVVFIMPARYYAEQGRSFPDEFRKAGYEVTIASNAPEVVEVCENTVGSDQTSKDIAVDIKLDDVLVSEYDAVIFIGGLGCHDQWDDPQSHQIAQEAIAQGKVLGAAGCAPTILAYAGVMQGKMAAICSLQVLVKYGQDYCQILNDQGAICVDAPIIRDGLIVTAKQKSRYFVAGVIEVIEALTGP